MRHLAAAVLWAALGVWGGRLAARPFRRRIAALRQWVQLLDYLDRRVALYQDPVAVILREAAGQTRFALVAAAVTRLAARFSDPAHRPDDLTASLAAPASGLWEEERVILQRLFRELGQGELDQERERIRAAAADLAAVQTHAQQEDLRRARLLEAMGTVTGLAIAVLAL